MNRPQINGQFVNINGQFVNINGQFVNMDGQFVNMDGQFVNMDGQFVNINGQFVNCPYDGKTMYHLPKRRSIRLPEYDYSQLGYYYLTICTRNRELYFDNNDIKQIIQQYWLEIPEHFNNIELDEWIVMPNHLHGIIVIQDNVGAIHESPAKEQEDRRKMLLPKIIGRFKMNSAKQVNILLHQSGQPLWQRNYYEHIIRNKQSLNKIRHYIKINPLNWETDRNNPKN